jgi:hypothetical protein
MDHLLARMVTSRCQRINQQIDGKIIHIIIELICISMMRIMMMLLGCSKGSRNKETREEEFE